MTFYNSENSIYDKMPFCRPLFLSPQYCEVYFIPVTVVHEAVIRLDYQTLPKSLSLPSLAGSASILHLRFELKYQQIEHHDAVQSFDFMKRNKQEYLLLPTSLQVSSNITTKKQQWVNCGFGFPL